MSIEHRDAQSIDMIAIWGDEIEAAIGRFVADPLGFGAKVNVEAAINALMLRLTDAYREATEQRNEALRAKRELKRILGQLDEAKSEIRRLRSALTTPTKGES